MSENSRQSQLLADLPFDVLLRIFSECDVDGVLNLSAVSTFTTANPPVLDCDRRPAKG